jgi:hypothetical protein
MIRGGPASIMRARAATCVIALGTLGGAFAQSYTAEGQIGYLQEWEIKASLTKTVTNAGADYSGPVTLRHVGLCSANGVEEKSGVLDLKIPARSSGVQGTLVLADDNCRVVGSATQGYSGLLNCKDGQGVPIRFSIEQVQNADHAPR